MMNKKADGGLLAVVIILIIVIVLGILINLGDRECSKDSDCKKENSYCGSDFACHQHPVIVKSQDGLVKAAMIIGISLIVAAWLFRYGFSWPFKKREIHEKLKPQSEEYKDYPPHFEEYKEPVHSTRMKP